jgi:hypothetical protein
VRTSRLYIPRAGLISGVARVSLRMSNSNVLISQLVGTTNTTSSGLNDMTSSSTDITKIGYAILIA